MLAAATQWRRMAVAIAIATVTVMCTLATGVAAAKPTSGAKLAPGWEATSRLYPTHLAPGEKGYVVVEIYNIGAGSSTGPVTMTDVLPSGLEATKAEVMNELGILGKSAVESRERTYAKKEAEQAEGKVTAPQSEPRVWECSGTSTVTCETAPGYEGIERPLSPGYRGRIGIEVTAVGAPGVEENHVTVSGGGAASATEAADELTISETPAPFGLTGEFDGWFSTATGGIDTQAGSHPFDLTLSFSVNTVEKATASGAMRDITIGLPPGIVGNPHAVPQCTRQQFLHTATGGCPVDSVVGVDEASKGAFTEADWDVMVPVYNLVPPPGVPAEFGFVIFGSTIMIEAEVRSGSDYGITTISRNVGFKAIFNTITLWGVPGEAAHDPERCGNGPLNASGVDCGYSAGSLTPPALLTLPTSCEGPPTTTLTIDSWDAALPPASESFTMHDLSDKPVGYSGCEELAFAPALSVAPDTSYADTPAGLTVDVKVPQEGLLNAEAITAANIKDTTVTLPEGMDINPGQATGLKSCGPGEDGLTTAAEAAKGEEDAGPAHCPAGSQVGTDEIETPLLSKPLKGDVYVLDSNPPHIKLLVTASGEGVNLKLVGDVNLDESTGRLTTTFANTPELPFTDFKLAFSGGARAALTTPTRCGGYEATSDFTPWSTPATLDVFPQSEFALGSGPGGAACPGSPLPFAPQLTAGATTDQAGGFTDFSMLLSRGDDQQRIGALQFKTPEGLLGEISKATLCPEPAASSGECPASSQIGHTVVEAGPGPYPLVVPEAGQPPAPIYLTGPYKGAPYGLTIKVPLHVGPFTLQTQIVRAKIEVDPITTQLTITTDELPQVIDGVPSDLREVDAVIDKPQFMVNPTNCDPSSFAGTAFGAPVPGSGEAAQSAAISSRFQVGSCRSLTFDPQFSADTQAKTSRRNGASLHVSIVYPQGEAGSGLSNGGQASIGEVRVELPKALPSRLSTLQKACTEAQFAANPAGCPSESVVGHAVAHTPLFTNPLEGPAYFVSHGGAKFPELVMVLQGEGVTVELAGETFIENGVTSSTFKAVPDAPISSFALTLPEGRYSALAVNGNLCRRRLTMPTKLVGQNGAVIEHNTPIQVEGCPRTLAITSHRVKGRTLTLKVYVPAAGKVKVSGKGIAAKTRKPRSRRLITLKVHEKHAGSRKTKVQIAFTPSAGKDRKRQTKTLMVKLKKHKH